MGDCNIVNSMEKQGIQKIEDMTDVDIEHGTQQQTNQVTAQNQDTTMTSGQTGSSGAPVVVPVGGASNASEIDNIMQDEMIDINRFRYNQ